MLITIVCFHTAILILIYNHFVFIGKLVDIISFVATAPAPTGVSEGKFTLIVLLLFAVFLGLILFCSYYLLFARVLLSVVETLLFVVIVLHIFFCKL